MSKIIQLTDYLEADEALACAKQLLLDQQDDLQDENQLLLQEVLKLEDRFESQRLLNSNLRGQLTEMKKENQVLTHLLQQEQLGVQQFEAKVDFEKKYKDQQAYWEKEYGLLKDRIRQLENSLDAKNQALTMAKKQSEQLLNELLAKS